jgi:hypothetical protein
VVGGGDREVDGEKERETMHENNDKLEISK